MTSSSVFQADCFVDSVGVNVHSWYSTFGGNNAYSLDWQPLLSDLGVRHVRDVFAPTGLARQVQQTSAQQLAATGIDTLYILDVAGLANNQANLATLLSSDIPMPGGIEPWNEYDIKPGYQSGTPPQWIADIIAFQPQLYASIKAQWPNVPVITSAVSNNLLSTPVGSVLPNADVDNIHMYGPPALTPEYSSLFAPSKLAGYANQAPGKPVWVTETGLITGVMVASDWQATALAAARLLPRTLLYLWAPMNTPSITSAPAPGGRGGLGVARTYIYELLDEHDSTNATLGISDRYGLFNSDLSPKMVATALSNLLGLLADPGESFLVTPLTVVATGPYADKFEFLTFQKRDGSYWLVFWMGYDCVTDPIGLQGQGSGADLPDVAYDVTLQFDHTFQQTTLFRPLASSYPTQSSGATGTIIVQARLDVQVLQLKGTTQKGVRARGMRSYFDSRSNSLG